MPGRVRRRYMRIDEVRGEERRHLSIRAARLTLGDTSGPRVT